VHHKLRSKGHVDEDFNPSVISRKVIGRFSKGVIGLGILSNIALDLIAQNYLYSIVRRSDEGPVLQVTSFETINKVITTVHLSTIKELTTQQILSRIPHF
jgi:hypothetical protein